MPLDEVIALMGTSLHSRLPVYRKNLDDVVGMIHVKDVLVHARQETPAPLSALIKQVLRSEEHTSELQSLMRISSAVFCLNKTKLPSRPTPNYEPHHTTE